MPISTDKNTQYGGNLVNQKYRPLANIQLVQGDAPIYSALLTNRWNLLQVANILPQSLHLAVPNWAHTIGSEAGRNPPLVVVSSNRSSWIKDGIDAADTQLQAMQGQPATFANPSDLNALSAQVGQLVSPPLYCPTRLGPNPNRNVYVVVHILEYETYKNTLAGTGITVVGWAFNVPNNVQVLRRLTGFGASRYAAIEFCKELRRAAAINAGGNAPWNYAWLIDDNVVALAPFPGFTAVENAMTQAQVAAGFQGGTKAETFSDNKNWARDELNQGRGQQTNALPPSNPPGILQQAVLWNIAYLTANNLNFGPVYLASGEDISLGNYFNASNIPYFYYGGISVRKEDTTYDNVAGSTKVKTARQGLEAWFTVAEGANPPAQQPPPPPPPPINVQPSNQQDGGVQTLANFVVQRVLPNSLMHNQAGNPATQNTAKCQGVEQITCAAIGNGHVSNPAKAATFQVAANQAIVRFNKP